SLSLSITHATRENTGSLFATPLFTCPSSAIYHSSCRQTYNSPPSLSFSSLSLSFVIWNHMQLLPLAFSLRPLSPSLPLSLPLSPSLSLRLPVNTHAGRLFRLSAFYSLLSRRSARLTDRK